MFKAPLMIAGVQPGDEPALRCASSGTGVLVVLDFQPVSEVVSQNCLSNQRKKYRNPEIFSSGDRCCLLLN